MMTRDPVLGELSFSDESGWVGSYTYRFCGRNVTVPMELGGYDGEEIDPIQRTAFIRFDERKNELLANAEEAIFNYYSELLPDLREQFGESADEYAPAISEKENLAELVTPTSILVKQPLSSDDRIIGLLYDCRWDPSLGLAVKFVNEMIDEVGPQDIVL